MVTGGASVLGLPAPALATPRRERSGLATVLRALWRDWVTALAALFLLAVILSAVFADQLVQLGLIRDPNTQSLISGRISRGIGPRSSMVR